MEASLPSKRNIAKSGNHSVCKNPGYGLGTNVCEDSGQKACTECKSHFNQIHRNHISQSATGFDAMEYNLGLL